MTDSHSIRRRIDDLGERLKEMADDYKVAPSDRTKLYSAASLLSELDTLRAEVVEECAKVADAAKRVGAGTSAYDAARNWAADEIAKAIRALSPPIGGGKQ
jgi:hypothetical protein